MPPNIAGQDNMADVATSDIFHFNLSTPPLHKRKRQPDHLGDDGDSFGSGDAKRRSTSNTHCLPLRLSPGRPSNVSIPPASYSHFTSIYQQPPTPVDTSDDESPGQQSKEDDRWFPSKDDSQPGSDSSISSLKAQCGDLDTDVDMDLATPLVTQPRIRRARSNDIMPPHRGSNLLPLRDNSIRERVPTPISSHFDNRVNELPNPPRHQFPPLRTNLSPMMEQESWISRDGLPSPVEDENMDMTTDRDDYSSSGLHMRGGKYGLDGNYSPSGRPRVGRLHMGFLNDCEKCIQKVPGHYSHILWS